MNIKFPNFEFNTWANKIVHLCKHAEMSPELFKLDILSGNYLNNIDEFKEHFDNQIHNAEETETWDYALSYVEYMQMFTEFMIIMSANNTSLRDVVDFVIRKRYHLSKNCLDIISVLMRGKSYQIGTVVFTPNIISNTEFILQHLQIKYDQ